jgi:hypothetical protein
MIANAWQGLDFGLGDDVDMLRDTTKNFAQDKIAPRADEIDRTNTFPRDLWPQLGALATISSQFFHRAARDPRRMKRGEFHFRLFVDPVRA